MGRSGWVRLIGREWVIWLIGGCGYASRSRGGHGQVWADMGKDGQVWMGQNDWVKMGDMANGWV